MNDHDFLITVYTGRGSINAIVIGATQSREMAALLSSACGVDRLTVHRYAGGILGELLIEYGADADSEGA